MMGSEGLAFQSVWMFLRVGLFWICFEQFSQPPAHRETPASPKALASFRKSRREKTLNACMGSSLSLLSRNNGLPGPDRPCRRLPVCTDTAGGARRLATLVACSCQHFKLKLCQ